ncbi:MAG TPA: TetR/AcrR family transcriptional regulator [Puia sp.]|jgi:AcrR family transcriptional regulator
MATKKKAAVKKGKPVSKRSSPPNEGSTEERIKEAARKLFTKKGFAATRTRDIAEEAGINLALLNYYFRSKQKLFDLIMLENFRQFIQGISVKVYDETATLGEKIGQIATAYIDFLTLHPDLPLFVLNELRGNPSKIAEQINEEVSPMRSHLIKQLQTSGKAGKIPANDPFHFIANLIGLTVFPFVGKPILQRVTGANDEKFNAMMQERKKLVPVWLKAMLGVE